MIVRLGITTIGIEAVMAVTAEDKSQFEIVITVVDIHSQANAG
jgi:hypothetical protein